MSTGLAATPVSPSMVLAIVDEARAKNYQHGVVGVRGVPDRALTADLDHQGQVVRVRSAESALAVREVLRDHHDGDWLVVVTDRDDDDLGAGILAHFVWQRLRSPDPWEAVRHRFAATGIDHALSSVRASRDLATGLLAATPSGGWPAAPAGVLTRRHALSSVAAAHLDLESDANDALAVLRWSMRPASVGALATLRQIAGDRLTDETLDWVASRAGLAADPVRALLSQGELADVVPLGIVVALLTSERVQGADLSHQAQLALVRLEPRWGDTRPTTSSLRALGAATSALISDLVHDRRWESHVERVLRRADDVVGQILAEGLAVHSDLLQRGFRARLIRLADALRRAASADPTSPVWAEVEQAWSLVQAHRLGTVDGPLLRPFHAAVRLTRWLGSVPESADSDLGTLVNQHMAHSAWADVAINDAFAGVDDQDLAPALTAVLTASRTRRKREERAFAKSLAHHTAHSAPGPDANGVGFETDTIWYLERLLPKVVLPLARKAPVFLLVMDGMSAATATEVLDDATGTYGWLEAGIPGSTSGRRGSGLSVLPSLTEASRASMLSGQLAKGQQNAEQKGYADVTSGAGKVTAVLFHKKAVDTMVPGWAVSDDVGHALNDEKIRLVTVVLNTIDDALDRADPAGTTWTAEAVKHLAPLLARARATGRTVVMTADHGHVVERRQGTQKAYPDITSGRSRAVTGEVTEGEVEISGTRVLTPDHRAVLAVDEGLRYGPLKAGYHGGASAAEVVVPVALLVPDEDSNPLGLALLPPQVPTWWLTQEVAAAAPAGDSGVPERIWSAPPGKDKGPTLFDDVPLEVPPAMAGLGMSVVASEVYRAQRKLTGRLIVTDEQVAALVTSLSASAGRLPTALAARALTVNEARLRGALAQVQQLLNVEGYAVIGTDPATRTVTLDERLLREQFEVR